MLIVDNVVKATVASLANFATGGSIGTAAATVDNLPYIRITQTTAGQTLTLPSPTDTQPGSSIAISNSGTAAFTLHGILVPPSKLAEFIWDGAAWISEIAYISSTPKFTVTQALVAGNNTITDSLGLATPFARVFDIRDSSTGAIITAKVTTLAANSFILNVGVAVTSARITSMG